MSDRKYMFPRTRNHGYRRPRAEAASSALTEESVCRSSHLHDVSDEVSAVSPAISLSVSPASSREQSTTETQGSKYSDKSGSQSEKRPNCYQCAHRRSAQFSAHSKCVHPKLDDSDYILTPAFMLSGLRAPAAKRLNVTGSEHGIRNGWFMWPMDFDPVWLNTCDGFEQKDEL